MLNYLKIIKQKLTILCHNHLFRADHPFTIETLVEPFCPVNSHKAGAHRFIIGDTFRVETLHLHIEHPHYPYAWKRRFRPEAERLLKALFP